MSALLLKLFADNWRQVAFAAIVFFAAWYVYDKGRDHGLAINSAKEVYYVSSISALTQKLAEQSAKIDHLKVAADAARKNSAEAVKAAVARAESRRPAIVALAKADATGQDLSCTDGLALVRDSLRASR